MLLPMTARADGRVGSTLGGDGRNAERARHLSALDGHVLIRPGIGESRNEAEPRLTDAGPKRIHKCQLPYGRVDRLVVHQLLHLVQDCLAPLGIQFGRLLLEEVVDLWVAAIGIGTALDDEGGETVAALPKAPLAPWIMFLSFL